MLSRRNHGDPRGNLACVLQRQVHSENMQRRLEPDSRRDRGCFRLETAEPERYRPGSPEQKRAKENTQLGNGELEATHACFSSANCATESSFHR